MTLRFWAVVLTCSLWAAPLPAESPQKLLQRTAQTYARLKTFQVEAVAERRIEGGLLDQRATVAVYASLPDKFRIEIRNDRAQAEVVIVTNGRDTAEFHPGSKDYFPLGGAEVSPSFSPERGMGFGEMIYDTIADDVFKSNIHGIQTLKIGSEDYRCAVVDVQYGPSSGRAQYSFWIALDTTLVLRRAVTFADEKGTIKTVISTVKALTLNDRLDDSVFEILTVGPSTVL